MKVLCVQCLRVNEVGETQPDGEGKVRITCPACSFVTVMSRRKAGETSGSGAAKGAAGTETPPPAAEAPANDADLYSDLFNSDEIDAIGEWMVRRLDGSELGPMSFGKLKGLIQNGKVGKIDEVRRLEERYVPAAFHDETAELFNTLETG
jgi:hypothetical protein